MAADLTVQILQEIRDELRASRDEHRIELRELRDEFRASRDEQRARAELVDQRFEVIETSLRDFAQQLVMLSRGMTSLLENRAGSEERFEALEQRVEAVERKVS